MISIEKYPSIVSPAYSKQEFVLYDASNYLDPSLYYELDISIHGITTIRTIRQYPDPFSYKAVIDIRSKVEPLFDSSLWVHDSSYMQLSADAIKSYNVVARAITGDSSSSTSMNDLVVFLGVDRNNNWDATDYLFTSGKKGKFLSRFEGRRRTHLNDRLFLQFLQGDFNLTGDVHGFSYGNPDWTDGVPNGWNYTQETINPDSSILQITNGVNFINSAESAAYQTLTSTTEKLYAGYTYIIYFTYDNSIEGSTVQVNFGEKHTGGSSGVSKILDYSNGWVDASLQKTMTFTGDFYFRATDSSLMDFYIKDVSVVLLNAPAQVGGTSTFAGIDVVNHLKGGSTISKSASMSFDSSPKIVSMNICPSVLNYIMPDLSINNETVYYTITETNNYSETIEVEVVPDDVRFEKRWNVFWTGSLGATESFPFDVGYKNDIDIDYDVFTNNRTLKKYNTTVEDSYEVNTNWLNHIQSKSMRDLFSSSLHGVDTEFGLKPIIVTNKGEEIKNRRYEDPIQYKLKFYFAEENKTIKT